MDFLSVCSGIEAASVAWEPLGWRARALAEIEPFPCHVLAHRQRASRPMFMPDPAKAANVKEERERKAALKAVGNSMAVNAMQWIGERIAFIEGILWEQGR